MADPVKRQMPPTLVFDTDDSMLIAHEEVFGPLLSVLAYDDVDEVITHINQRPQPLAAYWFGGDTPARRRFLDRVIAGGVTVNDIMWHVGVESLPFGGVGNSGMGTYHGRAGFETFSHGKPVGARAPLRRDPPRLGPLSRAHRGDSAGCGETVEAEIEGPMRSAAGPVGPRLVPEEGSVHG